MRKPRYVFWRTHQKSCWRRCTITDRRTTFVKLRPILLAFAVSFRTRRTCANRDRCTVFLRPSVVEEKAEEEFARITEMRKGYGKKLLRLKQVRSSSYLLILIFIMAIHYIALSTRYQSPVSHEWESRRAQSASSHRWFVIAPSSLIVRIWCAIINRASSKLRTSTIGHAWAKSSRI